MRIRLWSCEEREESEIGAMVRLFVVAAETEGEARATLRDRLGVGGTPRLAMHSDNATAYALWTSKGRP